MKLFNPKFAFVFLLAGAMLLSVSACGVSSETDSATEAPAATDAAAATEAPVAGGDIVSSFIFTNTGSVEICELYLSPTSTEDWGPDQLNDATIPAGEKFTLTDIPAGTYDAKAVGCDNGGEAIIQLDIHN